MDTPVKHYSSGMYVRLASLMPYYVALSKGIPPTRLGLAGEGSRACVQCLDPCQVHGWDSDLWGRDMRARALRLKCEGLGCGRRPSD